MYLAYNIWRNRHEFRIVVARHNSQIQAKQPQPNKESPRKSFIVLTRQFKLPQKVRPARKEIQLDIFQRPAPRQIVDNQKRSANANSNQLQIQKLRLSYRGCQKMVFVFDRAVRKQREGV